MRIKRQTGFTLIELLVVTTLSVILMLASSVLFMTFLVGKGKINSLQLIKNEGDYALSKMEFLIRNAIDISDCELGMTELTIKSLYGQDTRFFIEEDAGSRKIASNSGIYLTSGSVDLATNADGQYLQVDCYESDDQRSKYVNLSFILRKGVPGVDLSRDIVEQEFSTGVAVRSF